MTWTNAFDLGPCVVRVLEWSSDPATQLYSGTLGKGQSAVIADLGQGIGSGTIAVSEDGVVSLTADASNVSNAAGFGVDVIPQYPHDYAARLVGIESGLLAYNGARALINAVAPNSEGVDYIQWDGVGVAKPDVPDPADLSALTGQRDLIGLNTWSAFV